MPRAHHLPDATPGDPLAALVQELSRRVRDIETGTQTIRDRKCDAAYALMVRIAEELGIDVPPLR